MYDFGATSYRIKKYEEMVEKFIDDSLGVESGEPNFLTRIKFYFWKPIIERRKLENTNEELVRVFKKGKLVGEKIFKWNFLIKTESDFWGFL